MSDDRGNIQRIAGNSLMPRLNEPRAYDFSQLDAITRAAQQRVQRETTVAAAAEYALEAAEITVGNLIAEIDAFQEGLNKDEEIAVFVVGGPAGASFFPTQVRAINPDKVLFGGVGAESSPFLVVQHVSQLNIVMRAVKVAEDEQPRRIGFHGPVADEEQ